jgi:putative hydrolase of the HAD superfamily
MPDARYRAVLWDFGGVLTESPFEAFRRYERRRGLPDDFIRSLNAVNPDDNAWARFERGEIPLEEFDRAFGAESLAAGFAVPGAEVIALLYGEPRPAMVEALRRCGQHYVTACLTNNVKTGMGHGLPATDARAAQVQEILGLFDHVFESSLIGARKPEPRFYRMALEALKVQPREAVYLDDLGINLKPARAMGMTTIKVQDADQALRELQSILDLPLLDA